MNPDDNNRKKKRGPYKRYLEPGSNVPVPESTMRSREKQARLQGIEQATRAGEEDQETDELVDNSRPIDDIAETQDETDPTTMELGGPSNSDDPDDPNEERNTPTGSGDEEQDLNAQQNQGSRPKLDYVKKYNLNSPLHEVTQVTRLDALIMILHLAVKHCHTQSFVEHLIAFVNILFGGGVLDISYHIFKNLFPPASSIKMHYFCIDCDLYLGSSLELKDMKEKPCDKCGKLIKIGSVDSKNYFVTLSVREQIENILNKPGIKLVQNRSQNSDLCDVFDGEIFKTCQQLGLDLHNCLTVTFNTDGVNVHASTSNTLWPIFLYINEIIPEHRFQVDNLVLAGLWFSKSAPNMALYLKPFLNELLDLSQNGVSFKNPDGVVAVYPVFPVACSVDSVAKPKLVCQKQFNAYCGCLYCEHPNNGKVDMISKQRFYDTSKSYPLRTEDQVVKDMFEADRLDREGRLKDDSVNGFLGISVLLLLSKLRENFPCNPFSIIWSVVIDYMHACLEGVCADLIEMYQGILSSEKLQILNERISVIKPPQAMTRKPRPLSDKVHWKAKEYRAFLLYYSLPCLEDLLPSKHFSNLKLFVNAMHILLSDRITQLLLSEAKSSLEKFTTGYQQIYGLSKVTYNLHITTHFCSLVKKLGPLWCWSNFVFESGNGRLLNLIKGTRSIIHEMAVKYTKLQNVPQLFVNNPVGHESLSFCNDVLGYKYSKCASSIDDSCLTSSSEVLVGAEESSLLQSNDIKLNNGNSVRFYHRVIREGIIYYSGSYSKTNVFDDSCVRLHDNQYAYIDKIVLSSANKIMCVVKPIVIAKELIPAVKQCSFDCFGDTRIVPFSDVARKCVFISFFNKNYVCEIPNFYERD